MNGRRAVYFAGTNALHLPTFLNGRTQAEVFVVLRSLGPTNFPLGLWHISNGANLSRYPETDNSVWESM